MAAFCDKLMAYDVEPEEWRKLDVRVGDLEMRIKDLEAHLVRQLEQQLLAALPALLLNHEFEIL